MNPTTSDISLIAVDVASKVCASEDCETDEFTDEEIIRGVEKHFDGGLDAFFKTLEVVA